MAVWMSLRSTAMVKGSRGGAPAVAGAERGGEKKGGTMGTATAKSRRARRGAGKKDGPLEREEEENKKSRSDRWVAYIRSREIIGNLLVISTVVLY